MASHEVLREQLIEMGFDDALISSALKKLGEKATIESVIESIETQLNEGNTIGDNNNEAVDVENKDNNDGENDATVIESVEDKQSRIKRVEEKIVQRRKEKEEQEKEAERQREIRRRKDGVQMGRMKEEIEDKQRKRIADEMKKEKEEAKAARESILRQIAADREERKLRDVKPVSSVTAGVAANPTASSFKDGSCRLAIRLLDGSQLVQEFDSRESLSAVRVFVITQSNVEGEISFVMPPSAPFSEDDMQKPLNVLGLCPSARVHVVRR